MPLHNLFQASEDGSHRAWGNQRSLFYDGNELSDGNSSGSDDNLEEEEVTLAERRLSCVLKENDFEPHWLKVNELAVSDTYIHLLLSL